MHCALVPFEEESKMAAVQTSMYKLPEFYDESSQVELPKCMYGMQSYHNNDVSENLCNGDSGIDLSSLEQRQENILQDLENLQKEVHGFATKLGVKLPSKSCPMTVDHVISASPEDPPLSIFILQRILNQRGATHSTSVFIHSSTPNLDLSKLPAFEQSRNDKGRNSPCVITVVWKKASDLPVLVLSSNHIPLVGEFTIARHLCRTLLPDLYSKLSLDEIAQVDNWIAMASDSILYAKNKEQARTLHVLNTHLGNSSWLVGNRMTLADVAVASAVLKADSSKSTPANVKKWLTNFSLQ